MKKKSFVFFLGIMTVLFSCLTNDTFNSKLQFTNDTTAISRFVPSSAIKIPQGVWYTIDTMAYGIYPVLSDSINISYKAKLIPSLAVVDSSTSTPVLLSTVISGLQYGLQRFPLGSVGKLYVPSGLAFGEKPDNKNIPANANLLYEIKLLNVKGVRYPADTTSINTYLKAISDSLFLYKITAKKDAASGIHYSYDSLYSDVKPTLSNSIQVSLTAKILNAKTFVINTADTTLVLNDQITAFKLIMPKISTGTNTTIFVPSGYGYGSGFATDKIPTNSNLVYQVKLKKVF